MRSEMGARTVRLIQFRYAATPEGPWGDTTTGPIADPSAKPRDWYKPVGDIKQTDGRFIQERVIELPLPPDDAPPSPDGVKDGEVAEPDIVTHLREWPDRVHPAATHYLKHSDVKAVIEHIDRLIREAAGVREQLAVAHKKWWDYERDYILPCFGWARELGIDLPALVAEARGNCVKRFFGALRERAESAEKRLGEAEASLKAWRTRLLDDAHYDRVSSHHSLPDSLTRASQLAQLQKVIDALRAEDPTP